MGVEERPRRHGNDAIAIKKKWKESQHPRIQPSSVASDDGDDGQEENKNFISEICDLPHVAAVT